MEGSSNIPGTRECNTERKNAPPRVGQKDAGVRCLLVLLPWIACQTPRGEHHPRTENKTCTSKRPVAATARILVFTPTAPLDMYLGSNAQHESPANNLRISSVYITRVTAFTASAPE